MYAFKGEIPAEVYFDYRKRKECANGIGFEPKEKRINNELLRWEKDYQGSFP